MGKKFKPAKKKFVKIKPKEPFTVEDLRKGFTYLNNRFFNGEISPSIKLGFMPNCGFEDRGEWVNVDAFYHEEDHAIMIDSHIAYSSSNVSIALIHEMAHAYLHLKGYKGYSKDHGHGMMYQAEIARLFNAGAYDGLL
jgi:hypothetical protein